MKKYLYVIGCIVLGFVIASLMLWIGFLVQKFVIDVFILFLAFLMVIAVGWVCYAIGSIFIQMVFEKKR